MRLRFLKTKTTNLQKIEADHLYEVSKIHKASFPKYWDEGEISQMLKSKGMDGLVVSIKEKIVGFILYRIAAGEAEVITIATDKKLRRYGVGRKLMNGFIRLCLTERLESIFLEVDEKNIAAIKLYQSLMFKKVGERKGYYSYTDKKDDNKVEDENLASNALIMRLDLKS